jgi:hypothetical protein
MSSGVSPYGDQPMRKMRDIKQQLADGFGVV